MTRDEIVAEARVWIGTPYHHQASVKGVGTDCLGLIIGVYKALYGALPEAPPPYTPDWAEAARSETLLEAASRVLAPTDEGGPGDVVIFRMRRGAIAKHCGIVSFEGRFIHAHEGRAVVEVMLNQWWRRHIAGCFSFKGLADV